LRTKEQGKHLTLNENDDDDDDIKLNTYMGFLKRRCFLHRIIILSVTLAPVRDL